MVTLVVTAKTGNKIVAQVEREGVLLSGGACRIEGYKVPSSESKMHA